MKILVVDDGQLAINSLIRILCRVAPDCDYISAMTTEDALSWMRQGPMDAAFLNLEMPGMNGLALTRMIQKLQPRCNIIFLRGSRSATNSYRGEYMTQYSWAEVTRSALRQQANVQKTASIPSYYVPPTGF